jgi:glutamate-1-semialdehyde 2,1-aminomutase
MVTGREQVLVFEGCYGHLDEIMGREGNAIEHFQGHLGLLKEAGQKVTSVPFNDLDAVSAALRTYPHACLIAEPAMTNYGLIQPDSGYWEACAGVCRETGALLMLDETHTFALAYGGLRSPYKLFPDILIVGKGLGSGVPLGAYGMTEFLAKEFSAHLDRDVQPHGLLVGNTMAGNAVSLAATRRLGTGPGADQLRQGGDARPPLGRRPQSAFITYKLDWVAPVLGGRSGWVLGSKQPRNATRSRVSLDRDFIAARRLFAANRGVWEPFGPLAPRSAFRTRRRRSITT